MILLRGHSLEIRNRFRPESMQLSLEERNSSATITLGPEAPEISMNDWVKDETEPGKGIVWRVKTVSENMEARTRTVTLEHVAQTLKDRILFGEHKPADITGVKSATKCTARQAAAYALARQSDWKLGDMAENPSNPYSFNGETVWAALETITGSLEDVQWEFDLTVYPFVLHIRKRPAGFQSEMRMSRNITSLRRQIDRSRMYTRFYPIGKDNIHIDGDYISKNENLWGVVCKVETDQSRETKAELLAWAKERLARHCEPAVTITVSGLDLSRSTGEPLDRITVGRNCRVPLPDYGTTITERVTKLSWADKIRDPESVTVTMANQLEDVASIINRLQEAAGSGGRGARSGAKKAGEDHAWFVDTDTHVGMVAEAVAGPGADKNWSRVSSIIADGTGLHQRVTYAEDEIVKAEARIDVTEKGIQQEVRERKDRDTELSSMIDQQADRISLVVTRRNGKDEIKGASIIAAINKDTSSVKISADKIILDGEAVAKSLQTHKLTSPNIQVGLLTIDGTFSFNGSIVRWQNTPVVTGITRGSSRRVVYATDNQMSSLAFEWGTIVSGVDTATLHYLGKAPT